MGATMAAVKRQVLRGLLLVGVASAGISTSAFAQAKKTFNIPSEPLAMALEAFGKQSGAEILFESKETTNKMSPAVSGQFAPADALAQILSGSDLEIKQANNATFVVVPRGKSAGDAPPTPRSSDAGPPAVSNQLGEVVVTARLRKENLFNAPLSIENVSARQLTEAHIRDINDLIQVTPGFYYTAQATFSSSRVTPSLRFRGVTVPRNDPLEQQAGAFVDGVFLFGGTQFLTFDDIERVEVIKGPQSALFGRGTFSGAINFITRQPADNLAVQASAAGEDHSSYDVTASIEGPITRWASFRLSGADNEKGADFHATDGGALGQEHTNVINAQLVVKPVDGLRLRARHTEAFLDDSRSATVSLNSSLSNLSSAPGACRTGTQNFWCGALPSAGDLPAAAISEATSLSPPGFAASNDPNIIRNILSNNKADPKVGAGLPFINDTPHLNHAGLAGRFQRSSFELEYKLPYNLTFNASYATSKSLATTAEVSTDDAGNGYVVSTNILKDNGADFRLSSDPAARFSWVLGGNYFNETSLGGLSGTGAIVSVLDATKTVNYTVPAVYSGQGHIVYSSIFYGLHYDILKGLALDVEGRYQNDGITTSLGLPTQTTTSYKNYVPRVILTYKPTPRLTLYASYAQGALPGTTNSNTPLLSPALQAQIKGYAGYAVNVPTETLDSYEIGIKQRLGQFRYSLSAYYMQWNNLKDTVNTLCPGNICGPTVTGQYAATIIPENAKIFGLEGEVDATVTANWDASVSFDVLSAKYDHFYVPLAAPATGSGAADGKAPQGFPEQEVTFNSTYHDDFSAMGLKAQWYVRAEVNYQGRIFTDELDQSWIPDKVLVNGRLGLTSGSRRLEVYCTNIFDNKDWLSGVRGTSSNYHVGAAAMSQATIFAVLPRVRTVGARLSFAFD
jgi:iron complex outermembrane receptor protein